MMLQHLSKAAWPRTLAVFLLLVLAFLAYGRLSFYRDPGSMFYDTSRAFERQYSLHREQEVKNFVGELAMSGPAAAVQRSGPIPKLCAAFASVRREGHQYLPLAIASTVEGLSPCERKDVRIDVLLAHTNISEHPASELPWVSRVADDVHGYNVSQEQIEQLAALERDHDFARKGVIDYTNALETCYNTQAPWVVIFEDDIILADGWLVKTLQGIEDLQASLQPSDKEWLYMRLFNQERSTGWAGRHLGDNHEFAISAAVSLVVFVILTLARSRSITVAQHIDRTSTAIICLLAIPTFVILFFQAGKASLLPPAPGVWKENFGCCSQALVFPRAMVNRVREYLLWRQAGQIDLMINDFAAVQGLDRYALYPVQLQHVGTRSSRATDQVEAQSVWSMAYESQKPQELRSTHQKLLRVLYGEEQEGNCQL